jgi:hypothetical protein
VAEPLHGLRVPSPALRGSPWRHYFSAAACCGETYQITTW